MNDFREIGRQAYEAGQPASPALNAQVMAAIAGNAVGAVETLNIMKDFSDGWHAANLAAPVEGISR